MSIPKQHLDDKAYNLGNFFDYGNDYNRALIEQEHDDYVTGDAQNQNYTSSFQKINQKAKTYKLSKI